MATFHFAGNEMYHAMMISKAALAAHIDTGNAVQQLLLKRCEEYKRVTEVCHGGSIDTVNVEWKWTKCRSNDLLADWSSSGYSI